MATDRGPLAVSDTGGDRPALLFVHGIMMDRSVWRHQVAEFGGDHRVVAVDLRGYGESAAETPDISFEDHADDLIATIATLGLRDVTLVGWSMGGAIGQVLAAAHPGAIARLVLAGSTPQLLADEDFAHALPPEAALGLGNLLAEDFAKGCGAFCGLIAPEDSEIAAELTRIAAACRPDVARAAFQSSAGRNQLDALGRIETPTTIIVGAEDTICMPSASHYMADAIPGCRGAAVVIEGAGHAPFLTRPDAFNAALSEALDRAAS